MNKKLLYITICLSFLFIFSGCTIKIGTYTFNNFSVSKQKPSTLYYTNNLVRNLKVDSSLKIKLLDTNFYKEKDLANEDVDTIKNFTNELKKSNFVEKPKDLPEKPIYKLFFTFSKEKYVVNVYSEKYISVYPWDGTYSMDYIDMGGIQPLYNIYGLCKYLIPR